MSQNNNELINKVAQSGLITINLETYLPDQVIVAFDLKDHLFQGLILKEKDFRIALKEIDWESLNGDILAVFCSTDAIIPQWAYMLVAAQAGPHFNDIYTDTPEHVSETLMRKKMDISIDFASFEGKRVVIKGCGDKSIPSSAYLHITKGLQPYAQSIMYGEPCSTVPIFKRPRKTQ
jgi:hypothetical protein